MCPDDLLTGDVFNEMIISLYESITSTYPIQSNVA